MDINPPSTVINPPSNDGAFNQLPIELNKTIAHFLLPGEDEPAQAYQTADRDIANFSLACRPTNHAIDGDNFSFWRAAFRKRFALLPNQNNKVLRHQYRRRAKYLHRGLKGLKFFQGSGGNERKVISVLKSLINESFKGSVALDIDGVPECNNQKVLKDFIARSHFLLKQVRVSPPSTPAKMEVTDIIAAERSLTAIRIMLTQLIFEVDDTINNVSGIEDCQRAVYAATNEAPLYHGPKLNELNMSWVLDCFNFFRYYMMAPEASGLYERLWDLDPDQHPKAWKEPLKKGSYPLAKCWKGTYSFLEQSTLNKLRRHTRKSSPSKAFYEFFDDLNIDEGKIQSLCLDFGKEDDDDHVWPEIFEQKLNSKRDTSNAMTRAQSSKKNSSRSVPNDPQSMPRNTSNIPFTGFGEDLGDGFYATGWLNPLPDQCDIPGWQRITFMKHFEQEPQDTEEDNLWAYEGVVLPGGKFILGRWWYASDEVNFNNDYNGPFILWAVEPDMVFESEGETTEPTPPDSEG